MLAQPDMGNEAGRQAFPAGPRRTAPLAVAVGARAAVLVSEVPRRVADRRTQPACGVPTPEVVVTVAQSEMTRLVRPPVVPPRPWRRVLELTGPGPRFEMLTGRVVVHDLRPVAQDDAKIERGHHIRVDRAVPVGGCRPRQDGEGANRRCEQK